MAVLCVLHGVRVLGIGRHGYAHIYLLFEPAAFKARDADGREAAAEFALDPLLDDLSNNRPLRLVLPGVFNELPVPPYVVGEWRSLQTMPLS